VVDPPLCPTISGCALPVASRVRISPLNTLHRGTRGHIRLDQRRLGSAPDGAFVGLHSLSPTGTLIGRGLVTRGPGWFEEELTVDFSSIGSSHSLVEVYLGASLVSEAADRTGVLAIVPAFPWRAACGTRNSAPTMSFTLQTPGTIAIPGVGSVMGDRVVVVAEGGTAVTAYSGGEARFRDIHNAAVAASVPPRYLTKWGSQGAGDSQFSFPISVAVDANGNVLHGRLQQQPRPEVRQERHLHHEVGNDRQR